MYIIYYGKNNSIAASIAAAVHLETVSLGSAKGSLDSAIKDLYLQHINSCGRLLLVGRDSNNNPIFILNTSTAETIILPAITSVFDILQVRQDQLYLADTTEVENIYISTGLFLHKKSICSNAAIKLIYLGLEKEYDKLNKIITKTKLFTQK